MPYFNETELLAGCYSGDPPALEAFVIRFSNLVYAVVQRVLKAKSVPHIPQDVEDLHNSIFVKLLEKRCRKLRQYQGRNGCSLASWVRMIAVRTVIDQLRRRRDALADPGKLDPLETVEDLAGDVFDPAQRLDQAQKMRLIIDGMQALLPRDRLLIKLHCLNGLTIQEVAKLLKISETNAHSLKHRAIRRLREVVLATSIEPGF